MRRAILLLWLFAAGCFDSGGLGVDITLEVGSVGPVDQLEFRLVSPDDRSLNQAGRLEVGRTAAELLADPQVVRLAPVPPGSYVVSLVGRSEEGPQLVAVRCYTLDRPVVDQVVLGDAGDADADGDGFLSDQRLSCLEPNGTVEGRVCLADDQHVCPEGLGVDCDDSDPEVFPGARFICQNGRDEDCDGEDEPCGDQDGDGSAACSVGETTLCDCDDANPEINPGAQEDAAVGCNDGIDQDCDGFDACCDADGDGTPLCQTCQDRAGVPPELITMPPTQCIDDASCSPRDPASGQVTMVVGGACQAVGPDCDDDDPDASPSATERCDGVDNNCNGLVDELDECRSADLDGDGAPLCGHPMADPGIECEQRQFDCDAGRSPFARERCGDGIDEDVDGAVDEGCPAPDMDGDGVSPPADCDDNDPLAYPREPGEPVVDRCGDGVAQSCLDGDDRPCSEDVDGDGFVEPVACEGDASISPTAPEVCDGVDNDCDGIVDEVLDPMMRSGCAEAMAIDFFADDFFNCGGCRVACDTDADACVMGECDCSGEPGTGGCVEILTAELGAPPVSPICDAGLGCVDLATDPSHCGAIGRTCGSGETCMAGQCVCGATTGPTAGDPSQAPACGTTTDSTECCAGTCADVANDDRSCGACNYECAPGAVCMGSVCQCDPAQPELRDCNGDATLSVAMGGNGCETNVAVPNQQHCGACGNNCGGNATCMGGPPSCVCNAQRLDCAVGRPWCETPYSTSNCGDCGAQCGQNESCNSAGQCACGSSTGGMGAGRVCAGSNQRCCGGSCVNLTQTTNCRSCGNSCRANETCGAADCRCDGGPRCTGGDTCCPGGGGCVETDTDINNCGGCGNACVSDEADTCSGGSCRCNGGAACGGGPSDTCCSGTGCQNLNNDTNNCGACGVFCGVNETCNGSECQCSGEGGGGGIGAGPRCTGGSSTCCPGEGCVNVDADVNNCGGCGIACGPMEVCSGGQCQCSGASGGMFGGPRCGGGTTCCPGDGCVDLDTDDNNCSFCGLSCPGSQSCTGGMCS